MIDTLDVLFVRPESFRASPQIASLATLRAVRPATPSRESSSTAALSMRSRSSGVRCFVRGTGRS